MAPPLTRLLAADWGVSADGPSRASAIAARRSGFICTGWSESPGSRAARALLEGFEVGSAFVVVAQKTVARRRRVWALMAGDWEVEEGMTVV